MIITISGKPGSGKSTVAKLIAKKLKLKHYSIGDFMRSMAKKKKKSLLELSKSAEKSRKTDYELDKWQRSLAKKDNFVIDSRLGFHFIPKSIKIFLYVSLNEGAKRIYYKDIKKYKRKTEKENISFKKTKQNIKKRMRSERLRYRKYYKLDINKKKNYDFWLDTSNLTIKEVIDKIIDFIKQKTL